MMQRNEALELEAMHEFMASNRLQVEAPTYVIPAGMAPPQLQHSGATIATGSGAGAGGRDNVDTTVHSAESHAQREQHDLVRTAIQLSEESLRAQRELAHRHRTHERRDIHTAIDLSLADEEARRRRLQQEEDDLAAAIRASLEEDERRRRAAEIAAAAATAAATAASSVQKQRALMPTLMTLQTALPPLTAPAIAAGAASDDKLDSAEPPPAHGPGRRPSLTFAPSANREMFIPMLSRLNSSDSPEESSSATRVPPPSSCSAAASTTGSSGTTTRLSADLPAGLTVLPSIASGKAVLARDAASSDSNAFG